MNVPTWKFTYWIIDRWLHTSWSFLSHRNYSFESSIRGVGPLDCVGRYMRTSVAPESWFVSVAITLYQIYSSHLNFCYTDGLAANNPKSLWHVVWMFELTMHIYRDFFKHFLISPPLLTPPDPFKDGGKNKCTGGCYQWLKYLYYWNACYEGRWKKKFSVVYRKSLSSIGMFAHNIVVHYHLAQLSYDIWTHGGLEADVKGLYSLVRFPKRNSRLAPQAQTNMPSTYIHTI